MDTMGSHGGDQASARAVVTALEDDEGVYIVLPDDFGLDVGVELVCERIGDKIFITRADDVSERNSYRATHGLPPGD